MLKFFDRYWKVLTFPPIIFLIFCSVVLILNAVNTGYIIERDIELKGGKIITVEADADVSFVQTLFPNAKVTKTTGLRSSLLIETGFEDDENKIIATLKENNITGETSIRTVGPALGEVFWQQTQLAIIAAFILMSVVIFILFRSPVPCSAVMLAAATDMIGALTLMHFLGIELSLAAIGALMMIIGYSVDTDVLLTTEMLKSTEGEPFERICSAAKTGLTMSLAAIAVLSAAWLVSNVFVIKTITAVLLLGLFVDIPATWLTNAGILRWWKGDAKKS
ncbi:MAG: protein translocase subunit SecF [Candidatus Aenigmarchaeota archaeon]|nr:protein translocase subunit SecF [Candidatus Aenigmarchaeota archaeon]